MNDAKTEILRVRMTPMEKAALSRQANDQHKTMSEYIRSIAKCPPEVTRDEFEGSILQMIYEINKIGVNINQMLTTIRILAIRQRTSLSVCVL